MLTIHRSLETLACALQLLAWRFDPWLARMGWPWFELETAVRQRTELRTPDMPAGPQPVDVDRRLVGELQIQYPNSGRAATAANDARAPAAPAQAAQGWHLPKGRTMLAGRTALIAGGFFATVLTLPYANHLLWRSLYPPSYWQQAKRDMLRPPVYDRHGLLAGFVPGEAGLEDGAVYAVQPDAISDACVDLALLREDRHAGNGLRHLLGVDWLRLFVGPFTGRGGSTAAMQLSRQLSGWQTSMGALSRKWREAGAAQAVIDAHGGDYRAVVRTYLSTARFALFQGDVRGIAAAAEVMWGLRASQLSPAQCALLVTMLPVKVNLAAQDQSAANQWAVRKRQAEALLREAYGAQATAMASEVQASGDLPPRRALIESLGTAATYNLVSRTRLLVVPHLSRMVADSRWDAVDLAVAATDAGAGAGAGR